MFIRTYNSVSGNIVDSSASNLDFGDILQGQHNPTPIVLRTLPAAEVTISDLKLFLESKGGWTNAEFGYYADSSFISGIESGGSELSNHFIEMPDATSGSPNGVSLGVTDGTSDYVWLDVDLPFSQTGVAEPNYRFTFNFT